jgi:hypothetical protein
MINAPKTYPNQSLPVHRKHDLQSQNVFRRTVARAEHKGMKVNIAKTQMLLVSSATSYEPRVFIETSDGTVVESTRERIRILGFYLDGTPTMAAQVDEITKKVRRRLWVLRHLKSYGFNERELVKVYCSVIRPCIEYCSVVYHSMLTQEQEEALEHLQQQALKCIYGYSQSYRVQKERAEIQSLKERREEAVEKFALKSVGGKYSSWFPPRDTRLVRNGNRYREDYARCDRLKNSPLFYMRRVLNGRE